MARKLPTSPLSTLISLQILFRYETVNDSGWYPLCCGFGIPLGTVVFSTHPPQFANNPNADAYYNGSSASLPSSRNRVRFNEDGTPKGVLKNGQNPPEHFGP